MSKKIRTKEKYLHGRHKDTWKPLKCKMTKFTYKGYDGKELPARKCDCNNCPNKKLCGIPEVHKKVINKFKKITNEIIIG